MAFKTFQNLSFAQLFSQIPHYYPTPQHYVLVASKVLLFPKCGMYFFICPCPSTSYFCCPQCPLLCSLLGKILPFFKIYSKFKYLNLLAPLSFHDTFHRHLLKPFLHSSIIIGFDVCLCHGYRVLSCPFLQYFYYLAQCLARKRHGIHLLNNIIFMHLPKDFNISYINLSGQMSRGIEARKQMSCRLCLLSTLNFGYQSGLLVKQHIFSSNQLCKWAVYLF